MLIEGGYVCVILLEICLYSTTSPFPLPIKRLTSSPKSAKLSGHLLLRESSNPFVSWVSVSLHAGKWAPTDAVAIAETRLDFQKTMGSHQSDKGGFGASSIREIPAKTSHAYLNLLSSVQEAAEEEKTLARAVSLKLLGQWTKWSTYGRMDLSWKSILSMSVSL